MAQAEKDPIIQETEEALAPFFREIKAIDKDEIALKAMDILPLVLANLTLDNTVASGVEGGFVTKPIEVPVDYITSRALSYLAGKVRSTYFQDKGVNLRYAIKPDQSAYEVRLTVGV